MPGVLEDFMRPFHHREIVSDPTGVFARAGMLLDFTAQARHAGAGKHVRFLFQPATGTVFVKPTRGSSIDRVRYGELAGVLAGLVEKSMLRFIREIRVTDILPPGEYTPIDRQSVTGISMLERARRSAGMVIALAGLGSATAVFASTPSQHGNSEVVYRPGVGAMVGLTTLSENALGETNLFRGATGVRLFLGDIKPTELAACGLLFGLNALDCPPVQYDSSGEPNVIERAPPSYSR